MGWKKKYLLGLLIIVCAIVTSLIHFDRNIIPTTGRAPMQALHGPRTDDNKAHVQEDALHAHNSRGTPTENEMACKIPTVNPFDKETMDLINGTNFGESDYLRAFDPANKFETDVQSRILSRAQGIEEYWKSVKCCYSEFSRGKDDMEVKISKKCHPITEDETVIPLKYDFIRVVCKTVDQKQEELSYTGYFWFMHLKPEVEERASKFGAQSYNEDQLSIILLGLDSVSHANSQRFMQETRNYILQNMSGIEFFGKNKVGESTFANLVPTLTGWTTDELSQNLSCFLGPDKYAYFDRCPFIWKRMVKLGYRTVYGEDAVPWSILLDSNLNGFENKEFDYDFKTLIRGIELKTIEDERESGEREEINQWPLDMLLDAILKAATTFKDKLYFHFTWITSVTHNSAKATEYADKPVLTMLRNLTEQQLLNRSVVILMSDHGMTFGSYVESHQGLLESRMPMMYIAFPNWFAEKYSRAMKNLRNNVRRLTTPFDLYETLDDLLYTVKRIPNKVIEARESEFYSRNRGISLFLPIPLNRTCKMADIGDHWCICLAKTPIDLEQSKFKDQIRAAASFSVSSMNSKLESFHQCAKLELASVSRAFNVTPESSEMNAQLLGKDHDTYGIVFKVKPSGGVFEATVEIVPRLHLKGPISRINAYQNQGDCIDSSPNGTLEIKSMCYCLQTGV